MPQVGLIRTLDVPGLGAAVRTIRARLGLSQDQFRAKYHVSKWAFFHFEHGTLTSRTAPALIELAKSFPELDVLIPAQFREPQPAPGATSATKKRSVWTEEDRELLRRGVKALEALAQSWKPQTH